MPISSRAIFTPTDNTDYATPQRPQPALPLPRPAQLTVNASNVTKTYGGPNPTFTGVISGAVNGDSFAESYSTTVTTGSNAGTYRIVPVVRGANLSDYIV